MGVNVCQNKLCDIFDIVIHQNVRLSDVTVSDVLDSDHLPVIFNILDYVSARDPLAWVGARTDWDLFRSPASDLIQPQLQIELLKKLENS
jgi:hypothetical protein